MNIWGEWVLGALVSLALLGLLLLAVIFIVAGESE